MKKAKFLFSLAFTASYAVLIGLGITCLLHLLGIGFAAALDGRAVIEGYPRFIPFCMLAGLVAGIALVILFCVHIKTAAKIGFTKGNLCIHICSALVFSLPLTQIWSIFFDFLQKTF